MKIARPQFELTRVNADGSSDAPEIVPVTQMPWDTNMNRRGLLGVGIGAAAALFLLENQGEADTAGNAAESSLNGDHQTNPLLKAAEKPRPAHTGRVTALALTPDGRMLVSGSQDNTVKLWSMPEGEWIATLPIHTSDVNDLAITPDGKMLVTASADTLRLLTLADGRLQATMDEHTDTINAVAISPDGKILISAANDKTIRLWSLPDGRLLTTLEGHTSPVRSLALAPNGRLLATGSRENRLRVWSLPEARLLMTLPGNSSEYFAITPDSKTIAVGSYDIALRSLEDGRLLTTLRPGAGDINNIAISPDGKILVSASRGTLFFWSLPDGKQLRRVERVAYNFSDFVFSADSRMLLTGSHDSGSLWSLPDGQLLGQLQISNQMSVALFTSDSQRVFTGSVGGNITVWNSQPPDFRSHLFDPVLTASKSPDKRLLAHNGAVTALTISTDGKILASASHDNTAKLWSLPGGQLMASLDGHKENINDVAILSDGKTIITAADDKTIKLWALPETAPPPATSPARKSNKKAAPPPARPQSSKTAPKGRLLATLEGHQARVQRLLISGDGKTMASADSNGAIKIWSLPEGRLQVTLAESKNDLRAMAMTPDGRLLVTTTAGAREERAVSLWSLPEGRLLMKLAGHGGQIQAMAIAPDASRLVVASDDGSIRIWELPSGRLLGSLEGSNATSLAFTPDGKLLAASSAFGVALWSVAEGRLLASIEDQRDNYGNKEAALVFASNGRRLLSLVTGGGIRIWATPECQMQAVLETQLFNIKAAAVTPDGKTLATGDYSGVITLWDLDKPGFRTFLFDAAANTPEVKGIAYNVYDQVTGQTITYTLPCGSPIPPGAVCTCNCVPGTERASTPPAPSPRRSTGGGRSGGTYCTCNKICTCIPVPSDRNVKDEFETVDPLVILQRLAELPIQKWNYKWDDAAIRHIGPMAQDFAAAFAVGQDDKHIHPVDAQGVAFAAIQGLYRMTREKQTQIEALKEQLCAQQEENKTLIARIEDLERLVKSRM